MTVGLPGRAPVCTLVDFKELRHDREAHRQRAPEHFVGGFLDRGFEMGPDPFGNEIVGDGDLQAVVFEVEACRVVKPDVKTLRSDALRDGVSQPRELWIVCAQAAHFDRSFRSFGIPDASTHDGVADDAASARSATGRDRAR
jgi:hypothetical protein